MNRRVFLYPLLLGAVAALLWLGPLQEEPQPAPVEPSPWPASPPPPRPGGPPLLAPPARPGTSGSPETHAPPTPPGLLPAPGLLPGSALLDPATWPWSDPGIPDREAARRIAAIRWTPPRTPLPGEEQVPDPDRIGPCPPRDLPRERPDTPVVRRYIDPRTLEPTWVHRDGSITALHVYIQEDPDGSSQPGVIRRTAFPASD